MEKSITIDFQSLDRIKAAWVEIEKKLIELHPLNLVFEDCKLSIQRRNGKMQLLYGENYIRDCSAVDLIEAAKYLPAFDLRIRNRIRDLNSESQQTVAQLDSYLVQINHG